MGEILLYYNQIIKQTMIEFENGDLLLTDKCNVIVHQCNCMGVMGAGIAKQIKERWTEEVFNPYLKYCVDHNKSKDILGKVLITHTGERDISYVANMFAQYKFGGFQNSPFPNGRYTDYDALHLCLCKLKKWAHDNLEHNIGIPKYIGCGLARGDWDNVVFPMIKEIFGEDSEIKIHIFSIK